MPLNIEPRQEIFLVLHGKELRRCRFLQPLANEHFSIEQTDPPITPRNINEIVMVTYSTNHGRPLRLGFEARIKSVTAEDKLILFKLNDPAPCELRSWPRIKKDLLPPVRVKCQKKESQLIDISSRGVHIVLYDTMHAPAINSKVKLQLAFDNNELSLEGHVLRRWVDEFHRLHLAVAYEDNSDISKNIYT